MHQNAMITGDPGLRSSRAAGPGNRNEGHRLCPVQPMKCKFKNEWGGVGCVGVRILYRTKHRLPGCHIRHGPRPKETEDSPSPRNLIQFHLLLSFHLASSRQCLYHVTKAYSTV